VNLIVFLSSFFGYGLELPTDQFAWRQIECKCKRRMASDDLVLKVLRKAVRRIIVCIGVSNTLSEGTHIFFKKDMRICPLYLSKFIFVLGDGGPR
jgi:hypothetical protein